MNWSEINTWLYGVASALAGFVVILIRKVFTNEKQIELLKQQINFQKEQFTDLQNDLKEVRDDVKALIRGG